MNNLISEISDRFSLRPPQRESLCRLAEAWRRATPRKGADVNAALQAIHDVYATVTDFERDFPSLCFALATGPLSIVCAVRDRLERERNHFS